jgi:hypothetical protein
MHGPKTLTLREKYGNSAGFHETVHTWFPWGVGSAGSQTDGVFFIEKIGVVLAENSDDTRKSGRSAVFHENRHSGSRY